MKDLSPCCHTEGAPLEVSVICLSQYCLSRDHYKGIGFPHAFWVLDSCGEPHLSSSVQQLFSLGGWVCGEELLGSCASGWELPTYAAWMTILS